ncbi:unnamed protein product [Hydatigera taeniaeformis]|uniref:Uncharacterized protein n=1 Tax=Hydatigena taeniaeformis TaxID=6205 RepID=A0A0R3XD91_HYDTA|nr:unnamed protein product [Hydatigera taeniaeformis]
MVVTGWRKRRHLPLSFPCMRCYKMMPVAAAAIVGRRLWLVCHGRADVAVIEVVVVVTMCWWALLVEVDGGAAYVRDKW